MPSIKEKVKYSLETVKDVMVGAITTGEIAASHEELLLRDITCSTCVNYDNSRCKVCGCYLPIKITLKFANCPRGKW